MRTDAAAVAVAAAATAAADLSTLAALVGACRACTELAAARETVVAGEFPPDATLLLVGEAPGAEEDRVGRPFVGRAGRLLDELLGAAGLPRERVAVANVLRCRPPGNRTPRTAEVRRCRGWLERQVALAGPSVVVTLGATATRWALGPVRLADVRGRSHPVDGRHLVPTYHPSAALRFGPAGLPMALLGHDLAFAAQLAASC